ncbi:MAG: Xaa-Pro peptidase family protein [Rhodospirillales bacterium]|nr:Xaa-Pro peptidase family protein [Rhodospirillales bacterium]
MKHRTEELQRRLADQGVDLALLTDQDSIAYYGGFWGYLGVEFGRPTFMLVPRQGAPAVVTPLMESEMVAEMTWIEDVRPWEDAGAKRWEQVLGQALDEAGGGAVLGWERLKVPTLVLDYLQENIGSARFRDITRTIGEMRVIKSPEEIAVMRQAGQVAVAMVEAGKAALGEGVPEYEVALAVLGGGTRKAAEFLTDRGWESFISPTVHNLQVLQSGHDTSKVHRRSNVRRLQKGDPVYMCFCGMVDFKQYKLGFDREFFIGTASDEQARVYETTVAAQMAALEAVRPGVTAEAVHEAANEVYRANGFAPGYRTGRAIGCSFLEQPEIKQGDKTVLRAGMTFAIDGGITIEQTFGGRVGDSIVVTEDGFEYLTPYPKELCVV